MKSQSKKIVIVGASSGLGKRVALQLAAEGWSVGIAARREDRLREVASHYPGQMKYEVIDVTAEDAVDRFRHLIDRLGGMDVLLFATGIGYQDPEADQKTVEQTMATNVMGFSAIITASYHYFADNPSLAGGQIAAITSVAGTRGIGIAAAYSASKSFQQTYLDALDQLAHTQRVGIQFTDIRPGFIRTALLSPDRSYPLEMSADRAARHIVKAIKSRRRVVTFDWRWRVVVGLWRLLPMWLWRRLRLKF